MSQYTILDNFKEISQQIAAYCAAVGRPCSERVAAYTLRAITLDTSSEFEFEKQLTQKQLRQLIELTSARVLARDDPAVETLKMQAAFDGISLFVDQEIRKSRLMRDEETSKKIDKIADFAGRMKTDSQITQLYKLMFDLLAQNACVDKMDRNAEREIAAALQSAFPMPRVKAFCAMGTDQRRDQVSKLISIVLGIRLFNFSIGKGGAGFIDIPSTLVSDVKSLLSDVQVEIGEVGPNSELYERVIRVEFALPGTIAASLGRLQDEFRNRQQFFAYLNRLQMELTESVGLIQNAVRHYQTELDSLKSLVGSRISVPKSEVFPKFDAIGRLWQALTAEVERNNAKRTVFVEIIKFKTTFTQSLRKEDLDLLQNQEVQAKVDAAIVVSSSGPQAIGAVAVNDELGASAVRLSPQDVASIPRLKLEFEGYCPWTIVRRDALLLPGKVDLGLVRHKNKYYALIDEQAMASFIEAPDTYIDGVKGKVNSAPELIHLLQLQQYFPDFENFTGDEGSRSRSYGQEPTSCDASTETPLHFVEENKDKHQYVWNEWDLRRQAVQIVKLRNKRTHGCQTNLSHFKRDAESQVYVQPINMDGTMPGSGTQTGINKTTNTVVRHRYIAGLRGRPSTKMSVINLEL